MVCVACLLPLFLVPIVNILPLLFYYLMGKFYALMGWEYRKPQIAPPACPYKPPVSGKLVGAEGEHGMQVPNSESLKGGDDKQD
ncbi:hypothetical protein M5689_014691 [Euphorbia peplus]|nr:hypothetical protein M5689_014691 [Euphorbia peplus]